MRGSLYRVLLATWFTIAMFTAIAVLALVARRDLYLAVSTFAIGISILLFLAYFLDSAEEDGITDTEIA